MFEERSVFGAKSYEYAIGRIRASRHGILSAEQKSRIKSASLDSFARLLGEYGYDAAGDDINAIIDGELDYVEELITEVAPDMSLVDILRFERDALNLKLYIKAYKTGASLESLPIKRGGLEPEILRVSAMTGDYTLIDEDVNEKLAPLSEKGTSAFKISSAVDSAMFDFAIKRAKAKGNHALVKLLCVYGTCRNAMTELRMNELGMSADNNKAAFLKIPSSESVSSLSAEQKNSFDMITEVYNKALTEIGYDDGFGVIAQYYFSKQLEAKELKTIAAIKSFEEVAKS